MTGDLNTRPSAWGETVPLLYVAILAITLPYKTYTCIYEGPNGKDKHCHQAKKVEMVGTCIENG